MNEEKTEVETLAENIAKISSAMEKLLKTGLKRKAVVVLVKHDTHLSLRDINTVIDSLQDLALKYCVKAPKSKTSK